MSTLLVVEVEHRFALQDRSDLQVPGLRPRFRSRKNSGGKVHHCAAERVHLLGCHVVVVRDVLDGLPGFPQIGDRLDRDTIGSDYGKTMAESRIDHDGDGASHLPLLPVVASSHITCPTGRSTARPATGSAGRGERLVGPAVAAAFD